MAAERRSPHLASEAVVVSLAAGVTTAFLAERLPGCAVRVMPNTPALVGEGWRQ